MAKSLISKEISEDMRKKYQLKITRSFLENGTREVNRRSLGNNNPKINKGCLHTNGWYDQIKFWWGNQSVYVCVDCARVIKLKKDRKIN